MSNQVQMVSDSEMTECQFHNNCGAWCETPRELEHNLCEHCLEAHDEEMAQPSERHHGELTLNDAIARALTGTEWGGDRKRISELLAPLLSSLHQGEPVALPERKTEDAPGWRLHDGSWNHDYDSEAGHAEGWNACLDEIAKLGPLFSRPVQGEPVAYLCKADGAKWLQYGSKVGDPWKPGEVEVTPLYTHADAGEVERLRDALRDIARKASESRSVTRRLTWIEGRAQSALDGKDWAKHVFQMPDPKNSAPKAERLRIELAEQREIFGMQEEKIDDLRAQLAERDALLREALCHAQRIEPMSVSLFNRIDAALSASAEPEVKL